MACDIIEQLCGPEIVPKVIAHFESTIQKKELPDNIEEVRADDILDAVVKIRGCSKTQARRLLKDGAVKIDGVKAIEETPIAKGQIVKIGKRDFGKID